MRFTEPLDSAPRRKLKPAEFEAMAKAGIFTEDERVELIDGELVALTPPGERHIEVVELLTHVLVKAAPEGFRVSIQNPIPVGDNRPQPDAAVLGRKREPLLVIEVSDTSLRYDRAKAVLYAQASIPESWLVDVKGRTVEVHSEPVADGRYRNIRVLAPGDTLTSPTLPGLALQVDSLFPGPH